MQDMQAHVYVINAKFLFKEGELDEVTNLSG